mgnify:CR=1 FL=1
MYYEIQMVLYGTALFYGSIWIERRWLQTWGDLGMSDVWSKMIKELGKFGDTFAEKSEVYIRKAVDKGEELSKLGKIQIEQ